MVRDAETDNCNRPGYLEVRYCHSRILECGTDLGTKQQVDMGRAVRTALTGWREGEPCQVLAERWRDGRLR